MKVPPFIIGTALLFWGNETNTLLIGSILALVVESHTLIKTRYAMTRDDFIQISDLTSSLF